MSMGVCREEVWGGERRYGREEEGLWGGEVKEGMGECVFLKEE